MPTPAPLTIGQRVRTTTDALAMREGAFSAPGHPRHRVQPPAGTAGTASFSTVTPDEMPADYARDELEPAE